MIDDRAEQPAGVMAWLGAAIAMWRAAEPETPQQFTPPRGLGELNVLLEQVRRAPARPVGPPNPPAKLPSGYEYRSTPAFTWAKSAGLDQDVAALAWCLVSEALPIGRYPQYAWAIGEAVINASLGFPVPGTVMMRICSDRRFDKFAANGARLPRYYFGRQGGRWCASNQHPTAQHVRCAELLLERALCGSPNILAKGATQWLDCWTQVRMNAKKPTTNPIPEVVVARRYDAGRKWAGPVVDATGVVVLDPYRLMLFGPEGEPFGVALEAVRDGRRRWKQP